MSSVPDREFHLFLWWTMRDYLEWLVTTEKQTRPRLLTKEKGKNPRKMENFPRLV